MADITVTGKDWGIIAAVKSALAGAQINSQDVFSDVTVTTSADQAAECQFAGPTPKAIVRYLTTEEHTSPQDVRPCYVAVELIISTKVAAGVDESDRLQEILRLANAARNAIESAPPTQAASWSDSRYYRDAIRWGKPKTDTTESAPWAVCKIPVEFGFVLDSGTSH